MLKVLAACGNGMGTSQIIKTKISNVFKRLNIPVSVAHLSVGEAKGQASNFDVIFCSATLTSTFPQSPKTKIIGLVNLLSEQEIEQRIREAGLVPTA